MNRGRCFPLLGLILLLGSSLVACAPAQTPTPTPSPTGYTYYQNEEYGYSLSYPSNWSLNDSESDMVIISHPDAYEQLLAISIMVRNTAPAVPASVSASEFIEGATTNFDDFSLLSSQPLDDNWDWLIEYTHTVDGSELRSQTYIKQTNDFEYAVNLACESDSVPIELQNIRDSFEVVSAPVAPGFPFTTYKNDTYGYSLRYPSSWIFDDSKADEVKIAVVSTQVFSAASIVAFDATPEIAVNHFAGQRIEFLSDTLENFVLLSSKPLATDWDWLLEYTCTYAALQVRSQAYIKQTTDFVYEVALIYDSDSVPIELQNILDSFEVVSAPSAGPKFSFTTYKNDTYGYAIDYPSDWMLEVEEPKMASLYPPDRYLGEIVIMVFEKN